MQTVSSAYLRRSERVSATIPISLLVKWEASQTEHDAYTVDLSREGVRVRTSFMLIPGDMVGIVPWGDSGQAIPTRVVWVQGPGSSRGFLAGLEFLNTPPA
ncbi:MAG: PilZ domain-containing protein [Acidobacteriia bacterium]|nr:PilZ domain-containing protein [Terriglobia bacterium]